MQVSNALVPFAPEVNAVRVTEGDTEMYFLGRQFRQPKTPSKAGGYMTFHILFVKNMDFRILVPGFRLMNGKILPPQAKMYRTTFDHFHCGIALRAMIHAGVNAFKGSLPLDADVERATKPLTLTPDLLVRYNKIIDEDKGETIL
jgi:hypothetical protein